MGANAEPPAFLLPQGQDAGTYTCTAENAVGLARQRVHLSILALPVFTTLPGDRSLHPGDQLWLRCVARGSPTPHISWTLNDLPVTGVGLLGWVGREPEPEGPGREGRERNQDTEKEVESRSSWSVGLGLQSWPGRGLSQSQEETI